MSGRRTKSLRRKVAVGAILAYSTFGTELKAQKPADIAPRRTASAAPVAELPVFRFEIAGGTLEESLRAYEGVTGVDIRTEIPREILASIQTSGVTGTMSAADALGRLLDGSGIEFRMRGRRSAELSMQALAATIDVDAPAPATSLPMYSRPLVDTPRTITVIPNEVILEQGATTLRDVLRNTPGITFQAGEGGGGLPGDTFSMRGFSSGNDITLDGIREAGAYSRDAFNLERVEVLKGPSGAAAGRGSTGGSINLITKTAQPAEFTRVAASAGNAEQGRIAVDVNVPVNASTGVRLNAMVSEGGVPNRDVVHNKAWGFAPTLTLGMGQPTQFTLSYQHVSQDNVPDYGLPWAAIESAPRADQSNFYGLENYDYEDIAADAATATVEHNAGESWTLRNVSRWAFNHRDSAITAPRPPNRQLQQRLMDNTQLANHTSFSGHLASGSLRHDFAIGLQLSRERTYTKNQAQTTNQPQTTLHDPDPTELPFGPMPRNVGNPGEAFVNAGGIYAFDTVRVGSKWELNGGLRWDVVDTDFTLTTVSTGAVTELDRSDSVLSWAAGAVFKPLPNGSIYIGAGTSFNPAVDGGTTGAGLSNSPTAANNINLDPEKTRNLEMGTKWDLIGGRLSATAALFHTEKTNARTRAATTEAFVLAGKQTVEGIELGVSGRVSERLTMLAGYSMLHSEFEKSNNPAEEGADLAFVPNQSFNVWSDLRVSRRISAGIGTQYMDAVFRNATNTAQAPSYWLVDAMAAYEVNRSLTLRLNVDNLADKEYVDRVGGGHYVPGAGRSISLSAEIGF
jgi:catecholate siderophore receptor